MNIAYQKPLSDQDAQISQQQESSNSAPTDTAPPDQIIDILFSAEDIATRIDALAKDIAAAQLCNMLAVPILKGSFIFAADLIRAFHGAGLSPEVDFLSLSSYGKSTRSSGTIEIVRDVQVDVQGRDILLIDDILESGRTLHFARHMLLERGANRVLNCVLLDKPHKRSADFMAEFKADFVAFDCPDYFVVGYGMDMGHKYRGLPFVGHVRG